jgi:exopolysaccharide production protein ExoY
MHSPVVRRAVDENGIRSEHGGPIGGTVKRLFDVIFASLAIVTLLPLLVGCCLIVVAGSRGPILFRHTRIGYNGREFGCLKFRTMVIDAEQKLERYLAQNPDARHEWEANHKLRDDPRVTSFGRIMRRSSLDELPQLINVLRGEMSLVGPRPIVADEIAKYKRFFRLYTRARPGLTGLWQVSGRNMTTYTERVAYDVLYLRNWSILRDIRILFATVAHIIDPDGAY